jgi:hypothetical protein
MGLAKVRDETRFMALSSRCLHPAVFVSVAFQVGVWAPHIYLTAELW